MTHTKKELLSITSTYIIFHVSIEFIVLLEYTLTGLGEAGSSWTLWGKEEQLHVITVQLKISHAVKIAIRGAMQSLTTWDTNSWDKKIHPREQVVEGENFRVCSIRTIENVHTHTYTPTLYGITRTCMCVYE